MCEISEKIFKEGIEKGIAQGMEKGIREVVRVYQEIGLSREEILDKLCQRFSLVSEDAEKYLL